LHEYIFEKVKGKFTVIDVELGEVDEIKLWRKFDG